MKITLNDMRTATALVRYASTNWKGCFTAEEIRQYSKDVLTDMAILRVYLVNLAEDIDTLRDRHQYATEEIELFNKGKEILKRMSA